MTTLATLKSVKQQHTQFRRLRNLDELAQLLECPALELLDMAVAPKYHTFEVPKKGGGMRLIEDPEATLKQVQGQLNHLLQAGYYFHASDAAHGFVINPNKKAYRRNIVSNAQQHLGASWLLNTDIQDFFHLVTASMVADVFRAAPYKFSEEFADVLALLCTYNGRLPMGAPTSPVLSNWAFRVTDANLTALAQSKGWKYTRYADDMSFSSETEIELDEVQLIRNLIGHSGFVLNETKVKLFGPDDVKEVTGLVLGKEDVELKPEFAALLKKEITRLEGILAVCHRLEKEKSKWVVKFQQQIEGKINFAEQVLGGGDPVYQQLLGQYLKALDPPDDYDAVSWMDFGNY
jgi:RNA-directed DNA polymerase